MAGAADLQWVATQGTAQAIENYQAASTGFPMAVSNGSSYTNPPANSTSPDRAGSANANVAICGICRRANGYSTTRSGVTVTWQVSNILPPQPAINAQGLGGIPAFTYHANTASTAAAANGVLPYMNVTVTESVPTYLLSIMPWFHSPVTVAGTCNCGMMLGSSGTQTTENVNIPSYDLIGALDLQSYIAVASCTFPPARQTSCNNYSGVATAPENSFSTPTAIPVSVTFSQTTGGGDTLATGSFTGTVTGQVSCDGGQTWQTVQSNNFTNIEFSGFVRGNTTCTVTDTNQIQVRAGVSANGSVEPYGGNFDEYIYWGFYDGSIQIPTGSPASITVATFATF